MVERLIIPDDFFLTSGGVRGECNNAVMKQPPLTENEIHFLSWEVMSHVLELFDGDVYIGDLHPGGGTYDCLSLINSDGQPQYFMNRNGQSALCNEEVVSGIWDRAARKGPREAALHILSETNSGFDLGDENIRKELRETCRRIAFWIYRHKSKGEARAVSCWIDDTYYVGPAVGLLEKVSIPDSWKVLTPPCSQVDWAAWVYALTINEEVQALVNLKTDEAITASGEPLADWDKKRPALPLLRPPANDPKSIIAMPISMPHPDAGKYFSKVAKFNGYEVLGEDLAPIANAIAEHWHETGELPTEIDQVKGALFFAWRSARFTDGYPSDSDMPYLKALADAIDALEA